MKGDWRRSARACAVLVAVTGCVAQPPPGGYGAAVGPQPALPAPSGQRVALLLPLSGRDAELGRSLLRATQLARPQQTDAADTRDTLSTPAGARAAAETAVNAGAGIIVGPLTSGETDAVAAVTLPRHVPVLAFTSDAGKSQPYVWAMGITPAQQVRTLLAAAAAEGRRRVGALLPANAFGDALAAGLLAAAAERQLAPPVIARYQPGQPPAPAIAQLGAGSSPIDALLLGNTAGNDAGLVPALQTAGLGPDKVRLMGTALWSREANAARALSGAWFVGPEPGAQRIFEQNYMAKFGTAPREVAGVAFDAAGVAQAVAAAGGIDMARLLAPGGFSGANGTFVLLTDGHVQRELGLFQIGPDGVRPLAPPPPRAM